MNLRIYTPHFILLIVTIITYSYSFSVPYYLDDFRNILENPVILNGNVSDFLWKDRFIGTMSFYIQNRVGFSELWQHHFVNVLIHSINTILVYIISKKLILILDIKFKSLPLFCALVFSLHPLNSQPVIYIVQRFTLLSALFYFIFISFYLHVRCKSNKGYLEVVTAIVGLSMIMLFAWFSKQNAASLLLIPFIIEIFLFKNKKVIKYGKIGIYIAVLTAIYLYFTGFHQSDLYLALDRASRETDLISRTDYFLAQLSVLWIYIGKFLIPLNLRLEYSIFTNEFSSWVTFISAFGHVALISVALLVRKNITLFSLSVFLFYIGHSVESGIIPIRDLAFEHRTYIPNLGLSLAFGFIVFMVLEKFSLPKRLVVIPILCGYTVLTLMRIDLWIDKKSFFEYEMNLSPKNVRVLTSMAKVYRDLGEKEKSDELLKKAYHYSDGNVRPDFAANYLAMLVENKQVEEANSLAKALLSKLEDMQSKNLILHNLGVLNYQLKNTEMAKNYFSQVIKNPAPLSESFYVLAIISLQEGNLELAEEYLLRLLDKFPNHENGKVLLERVNHAKKRLVGLPINNFGQSPIT